MQLTYFFPSRSNKLFVPIAVLGSSIVFLSLFLFQAHADTLFSNMFAVSDVSSAPAGTVNLAPQNVPIATASTTVAHTQMIEMHIANDGLVLLRGAQVVSVSGNSVHVALLWGTSNFAWDLEITSNTKFLGSSGEKESLSQLAVGDTVTATGMLVESGAESVVDTQYIRKLK